MSKRPKKYKSWLHNSTSDQNGDNNNNIPKTTKNTFKRLSRQLSAQSIQITSDDEYNEVEINYGNIQSYNAPVSPSHSNNADVDNNELHQFDDHHSIALSTDEIEFEQNAGLQLDYQEVIHSTPIINEPNDDKDRTASSLQDLLMSDGFFDIINAEVNLSKGELLLLILKFSLEQNLSQTAISNLLKLINCIFNRKIFSDTRYLFDKIFNKSNSVEYHAICPMCTSYLGIFERRSPNSEKILCKICKTIVSVNDSTYNDFFITMNPSTEIKELLQSNDKYYNYVVNERLYEKGIYKDVYDGDEYRKLVTSTVENNTENSYATIVFNSDGSPVFESSIYAIWPIQIILNELPLEIRTCKPITCGLWFGKKKPDMNIFLQPFVNIMNELANTGIVCNILNMPKRIKIYSIICCVDSVARAPMQGLTQFNGHYGCNWCLHPGEWVNNANGKQGVGSIKYPMLDYVPKKREDHKFLKHMQKNFNTGQPVYGVKCTTPLINLQHFKITCGFVVDPMHCVELGIGRQFTEMFIRSLSSSQIDSIDNTLLNIKYPHALTHLTRSLKDRKFWKSKDWQNWILYSSIPVLQSVLQKRDLLHWAKFVEAIHLLSQTVISKSDIKHANHLLKQFVADSEILYSKSVMTYNVHQLIHIAQTVTDWGPLWAHSGYPFESGNGKLLMFIQAAKGIPYQVTRCIAVQQNEMLLKSLVFAKSKKISEFYNHLSSKNIKKTVKSCSVRYFGAPVRVTDLKFKEELQLSDEVSRYNRMLKNLCLYSSKINRRSNNSFALIKNNTYIKISYFLYDEQFQKEYTICRLVKIENFLKNQLNTIKRVIEIDRNETAFRTEDIDKICVFVRAGTDQYICAVSNVFIC